MFDNLRRTQSATGQFPVTPPYEQPLSRQSRRRSRDIQSYFKTSFINERSESPPPQPLQRRLTTTLLESSESEFRSATQHPFLEAAGQGKISKHDLSRWLSQDRLYAENYISFISSLIARVALPHAYVSDRDASLRWRMINLLNGSLQNILQEIEFFTKTAKSYDLQLDVPWTDSNTTFGPNPITEQYISLFRSFHSDPQQSLLEGLIVLWATEKCYLEAWTHASTFLTADTPGDQDGDGGALRNEFIPNWSSKEFSKFVDDLANITDELAAREGALRKVEVYRALWLHILDVERGFWPEVNNN